MSEQILSFFLCEQSNNANNILKKKHVKIKKFNSKRNKTIYLQTTYTFFPLMHILKVQIEYEDQYKVVSQQRTKALIQKENYCRIQ